MQIETIIEHTTRGIYSVEDKLSIATVFLFCFKRDSVLFAELLYTKNVKKFIENLNADYSEFGVDFAVKLDDKLIARCFGKTRKEIINKYDKDGYYKALYTKDPYALEINEIKKRFSKLTNS